MKAKKLRKWMLMFMLIAGTGVMMTACSSDDLLETSSDITAEDLLLNNNSNKVVNYRALPPCVPENVQVGIQLTSKKNLPVDLVLAINQEVNPDGSVFPYFCVLMLEWRGGKVYLLHDSLMSGNGQLFGKHTPQGDEEWKDFWENCWNNVNLVFCGDTSWYIIDKEDLKEESQD